MCQSFWNVIEVGNAHGEYHIASADFFSSVEFQQISLRRPLNTNNHLLFQFRHHPFPEGEPVSRKSIEPNRNACVTVFNTLLGTELSQCELIVRVGNV